jgi:prepilin-type N-terminal cleavage/methylation domain-containing protein
VAFTLVEIAIVIVVLSIIAAIGVPRLSDQARRMRVNQAAQVIAADLELASSLAARERRPVRFRVQGPTDASWYTLRLRDTTTVLLRRSLGQGSELRMRRVVATPATVDFFPGGVLSGPMRIEVSDRNYLRAVTVTRAGFVRVTP